MENTNTRVRANGTQVGNSVEIDQKCRNVKTISASSSSDLKAKSLSL